MYTKQSVNICDGVNLSYIKDSKFKTSHISVSMFVPLSEETAGINAILSAVLERGCKKYPEFISFNKRLEELYGANIGAGIDKFGEVQLISISAGCINDNVSFDRSKVVTDVAQLLCDIIFEPCTENGKFMDKDINQAKRQIIENIKSEYNDKKLYAKLRCEQLMCENEKFGINKYGQEDNIKSITSEEVFNAWKKLLESSKIEIMISGSADFDLIYKMFKDKFSEIERKNIVDCSTEIITKADKVREFTDSMDVSQCKLVMGFRTPYSLNVKNTYQMRLMSALLGGTPNSKLFLNVREELSLCYYCASRYNKDKGVLFIESGVEKKNLEKAKKEILNQLESVKKGDFTEDELTATKLYLTQMFEKVQDNLSAIDSWYLSQTFSNAVKTPLEAIEIINDVTREEIIEAANSLSLDTIYALVGKGGNNNED